MLKSLVRRNIKLFFKDKGSFLTAMITPLILLLLYSTFLGKIYRDSFASSLPAGVTVSDALLDGTVGGQLVASLLAVSCVTVSFCVNLIMIQDKTTGAIRDLLMAPVKKTTLALAYYLATLASSLIISMVTFSVGLIYLAFTGWYLTVGDILLVILDIFLLCMFATALSSIICHPLSTQGAASAVGTLVSACYGFLCGAYMPISSFGEGLQKVLSCLPGTYGTALLKNHLMQGSFEEMRNIGFPGEVVDGIRRSIDLTPEFFGHTVTVGEMYAIMAGTVLILVAVYVLMQKLSRRASGAKAARRGGRKQ